MLLVALAKAADKAEGLDAVIILQVHDEIIVECAEDLAADVSTRLAEAMTEAWLEVFPGEPAGGIVDVHAVRCWADAKE